jgi:TolB-like protein/predicted Zn-dependent protease
MTPERWTRLAALFDAVVARPPAERAAVLAAACPDDPALQDEVARLLRSDAEAGSFGDAPAYRFVTVTDQAKRPTPDAPLAPGSSLGRYRVVELVGSGGMGEVYRAHDPELGRDVGIKVLARRRHISADELSRFGREARAVAALNHSNILTVFDVGVDHDTPYVVAELLEGETLRVRLERGALPVREAVDIARQIASGLAAAHDRGIIHRDLKPENLFVTNRGVAKILDFGLAKQTTSAGGGDTTEPGLLIGTAGYMAPELVRGAGASVQSDLFSFGAVLYEMLTGCRAFTGGSTVETMHAVLAFTPARMDALPPELRAVVEACLAKEPGERFASAHVLSAALSTANQASAKAGTARAWVTYGSAAMLALLVVTIAAPLSVQRSEAPPSPGATGRPALAVLPFDDRSGDRDAAWLSTGLAEMLITSLAQTPGVDVIGTERLEASFRELRREPSDRSARGEVARHAGAGALLVGALFKVGSDFRIETQVQDAASGRVVIARTRQGPDVFALVDAIGHDVRAALDVAHRPAGRPLRDVTTASLDAYALYATAQRARHNLRYDDARKLFEEALRVDPQFTLARAQLADVLERLGEDTVAARERNIVKDQLDHLPDRQRLLAEAVPDYDRDPARTIALLERLLEKYPDEDEAYDSIVHAYTHSRDPAYRKRTLALMQRWARAIPGPGTSHFHNHYGYAYIEHGLFADAEREFRAYIRVSPAEANAYDSLAELFLMTGRPVQAVEQYDEALARNPLFGWSHLARSYALAAQGRYDDAFSGLATLSSLGARAGVPGTVIHTFETFFHSRIGHDRMAARHLESARSTARDQGNADAQTDADLMEAAMALDRGDRARALEYAARVVGAMHVGDNIMRTRRVALAQLVAGIAEARAGAVAAAKGHLAAQQALAHDDPMQASWQQGLIGEIALAEGRLDDAERAFRAAEFQIPESFSVYPTITVLANNIPCRDGLARTAVARGDLSSAIAEYRRLNTPDVTSKWHAIFEPRYAWAAAELADRVGETAISRSERARFLQVWKGGNPAVEP